RLCFSTARRPLASSLRRFADGGGRVGLRGRGARSALAISSRRRSSAASLFRSRLRCCCDLITTTPSAEIRRSRRASSRCFHSAGRACDAPMSNRRCAAVATLLTFCPPAPWARTAVSSISPAGISIRGLMRSTPPFWHTSCSLRRCEWSLWPMTIRVHVACDDTAYRAAIADYLATEREIEVVGVSDEGQVGAAAVRLLAPDVIVLRAAATADAAKHVRAFRTAAPGRALIAFCAA